MNTRINKIFSKKSKKLLTFVTGGDPNLRTSRKIIDILSNNGADLIEIGMPFSDPMADGPTIQLSSNRAILQNINLNNIFDLCKKFRQNNSVTPLILMGYYNVIYNYGLKNFINKCEKTNIDGLIIVDLQPEEDTQLLDLMKNKNLIRLITPTTDKNRLKTILKNASGFLYYVTITGITGQQSADIKILKKQIKEIKKETNLPVVAGFGIKSVSQVREVCKFSDGVVVGSAIVKIIEKNIKSKKKHILQLIKNFVIKLKKGTL